MLGQTEAVVKKVINKGLLHSAESRVDLGFGWTALCLNKCWSMGAVETAGLPRGVFVLIDQ